MSLRLRLLLVIGLSLTVMWSIVASWMFMDMRRELSAVLDDRLLSSTKMVAGLMSQMAPSGTLSLQGNHLPLDVITRDGLACEVSIMRGEVSGVASVRTEGSPGLSEAVSGFGTYTLGGKPWRVYVLEQNGLRIATADRIDVRDKLVRDMALSAGVPFVVALIGSLGILWMAIGHGLRPVEQVRNALAYRHPEDMTPLADINAPSELRPFIQTVHKLLERVRETINRERRFTDDAAHELRTPITTIKTNVQVARLAIAKGRNTEIIDHALLNADHGVIRLQSTLEQLLTLARLDNTSDQMTENFACVDSAIAQAINDVKNINRGAERLITAQYEAGFKVNLPELLLVCLLRNLLDNALRYSPQNCPVIIQVMPIKNHIRFIVQDEGSGLTEKERKYAVRRFWRKNNDHNGSGLGLSIVSTIINQYGGGLALLNRETRGLEVILDIPEYFSDPKNF